MDHQAMESLSRRRALGVAAVAAAAMIGSEALKAQPALAVQGRRAGECNPDTQTGEGGVLPYAAPKTASYDSRVASAKRLLVVVDYQIYLDDFLTRHPGAEIDYIHGEQSLRALARKPGSVGFLLPELDKKNFFSDVKKLGVLPRKTFSMGEADEKRFYMEAKEI